LATHDQATTQPGQADTTWLALKVTSGVGAMWCAYAFAALALVRLPDAIKAGRPAIIGPVALVDPGTGGSSA